MKCKKCKEKLILVKIIKIYRCKECEKIFIKYKKSKKITKAKIIWNEMKPILQRAMNKDSYERWIKPIKTVLYSKNEGLLLKVRDDFYADWVKEHYYEFLLDALRKASDKDIKLSIISMDEKI